MSESSQDLQQTTVFLDSRGEGSRKFANNGIYTADISEQTHLPRVEGKLAAMFAIGDCFLEVHNGIKPITTMHIALGVDIKSITTKCIHQVNCAPKIQ